MNAYSAVGWENFFVAQVGAAAALAGLLFVAVSINLKEVLRSPQLPGRAAESLIMLVGVLASATLGLVPGQSSVAFGAELATLGLLVWAFPVVLQVRAPRVDGAPRHWMAIRVLVHQVATVPLIAAGASVLAGAGGGLYWLAAATILSFAGGMLNAWVLLIEIQR